MKKPKSKAGKPASGNPTIRPSTEFAHEDIHPTQVQRLVPKIKIGTTANLLYGYDPSWLSESKGNDALFHVPEKALREVNIPVPASKGSWSLPSITLHDTPTSLLDTLLPLRIANPSDGTQAPTLPSGTLMIGDSDREEAMSALSDTLGVDLSNEDAGFALVQLKRVDDNASHASKQMGILVHSNPVRIPEEYGVSDAFRAGMSSLKRIKQADAAFTPALITKDIANDYLEFYKNLGTHFVSDVILGDVIFQVFSMPKERYERVKNKYKNKQDELSGSEAIYFNQYTTNSNEGEYGYVQEYGHILSFSQSDDLKQSVKAGKWIENTFSNTQTIFAPYQGDASLIPYDTLDEEFTDVTAVEVDLTSLTLFAENNRKLVWRRVFKGSIIQKYQGSVQPEFVRYNPYDIVDNLQQTDIPGFLTSIATPTINTYKPSLDLSTLQFVASDQVESFTLYTNYLHNTQPQAIQLPGKQILISGQVLSLENKEHITTIQVDDEAFDSLGFSSQHFFGALIVTNASDTSHYTLVDGLKYTYSNESINQRSYVEVSDDVRTTPPVDALEQLKNNLNFNFAFAETGINSLSSASNPSLKKFLQQSMLWISQIIPSDTEDKDLLDLRVRALDYAYIDKDLSLGTFVPILPYEEYQEEISSILALLDGIDTLISQNQDKIDQWRTKELIINTAQELNENIQSYGNQLTGYIQACAEQQKSLSGYYDSIIDQKRTEKAKQDAAIGALEAQLHHQKAEVTTAVENYKQAYKDWQTQEEIKFGLTVATDVFTLGTSIAIPASAITDVEALGLTVQRIQKFLNVANATATLYEDTNNAISDFADAQSTFDGISDTLSSTLNWDEMSVRMENILNNGPDNDTVKASKNDLAAAFKTLVLRGKAYTIAQGNTQQLAREIYNQQRQKDLTDEQANRLDELNTNLNPAQIEDLEPSKIDLIGLTGSLSLLHSQMLGVLSKAFILQDQALRYTYMQPPTAVQSFNILGFKLALATQESNKNAAESSLNQYQAGTTTEIPVEVEIPVQQLKNGSVYEFDLHPDNPAFFKYVNLRVHAVTAKIDGLQSTDGGEYLIKLAYSGRPFYDRTAERALSTFNTLYRERIYDYKVEDNSPLFTDKGTSWSDNVNPITPFSTWEISLPNTETNEGLTFEGLTAKVTLGFVLVARIHDATEQLLQKNTSGARPAHSGALSAAVAAPAPQVPSPQDSWLLLSQMTNQSVTNGFDVVFNMNLDKINQTLKSQYEALKSDDSGLGGKITADVDAPGGEQFGVQTQRLTKYKIDYGYPKLQWLVNNNITTNLEMEITSGSVQYGTRWIGDDPGDMDKMKSIAALNSQSDSDIHKKTINGKNKLVLEHYDDPQDLGGNGTLKAVVDMTKVEGVIDDSDQNILSVILDMSKGAFEPNNIEIDMSDEQKERFSAAVKGHFVNNPVNYVISSLDLRNHANYIELQPNEFKFKASITGSGNKILQLFIMTHDRKIPANKALSIDVSDPIPEGADCSMIISSARFFGNILPHSMNKGWTLVGRDPGNQDASWTGEITSASITTNVDLSSLSSEDRTPGTTDYAEASYYPEGGNPVTVNLNGITIQPHSSQWGGAYDGKMTMKLDKQIPFKFVQKLIIHSWRGSDTSYKNLSTDVALSISGMLSTEVTGSGRDQGIKTTVDDKDVTISARTSGGGPCGSDDLQAQVNSKLKEKLPGEIKGKMAVSFNSVSIFALKNLLFPSENYIDLKESYVPGDLLILGGFTKD